MTTNKEKINVYESVLHRIQMYAEVSMDEKRLDDLIRKICVWSYAHRCGNGMLTARQQNKLINDAFKKLK